MPKLTRRRSADPHRESWNVYYDDVRIGAISKRSGVPVDVDQWGWSCGFYPGLHPGQHRYGSAATFDQARADFEAAWAALLSEVPAGAFREYRRDRKQRAEILRHPRPQRKAGDRNPIIADALRLRRHVRQPQAGRKLRPPLAHLRRPGEEESLMNKFVQPRPYADLEVAARKIIELDHAFEPIQDG
jgi:hypothetical protein